MGDQLCPTLKRTPCHYFSVAKLLWCSSLDCPAQFIDGVQVLSNAERMAEGETHAVALLYSDISSDGMTQLRRVTLLTRNEDHAAAWGRELTETRDVGQEQRGTRDGGSGADVSRGVSTGNQGRGNDSSASSASDENYECDIGGDAFADFLGPHPSSSRVTRTTSQWRRFLVPRS